MAQQSVPIEIEDAGDYKVVRPSEDLDVYSVGSLRDVLGKMVESHDADTEVQKQAVFAISQRPKDEAVPLLIKIARTHAKPEVRKQAIFWLGQTGDERALEFFKEILTK